ncbi:ParA family protein [Tumebacillus permanentifrigoris]|uniref:Chromosome partitioning protein n=1 Tax=Tumebacillus permanentifrigoris TaxID=378543 RepID=A0A316D6H5_9BACL|nr:AAA family ATPase [Tumebacillus permanentifrigoris]PWK03927.1 chromosome partitioning protein [Tumebacillus permanentifrigoris]
MPAITTSVITRKGGVGKTTLTHHIGTGLARRGKRILLIDLDTQSNLSILCIGHDPYHQLVANGTPTIRTAFDSALQGHRCDPRELILKGRVNAAKGRIYNNVDLILAHKKIGDMSNSLAAWRPDTTEHSHDGSARQELSRLSVLKRLIDQVQQDYDFILFDCPADLNLITRNALIASNFYLVPITPEYLPLVGLNEIRNDIETLNRKYWGLLTYLGFPESFTPTRFAGLVFNRINLHNGGPKQLHQHAIDLMRTQLPKGVFENYLINGDAIPHAAYDHLPVWSSTVYNANKQIDAMTNITQEFMLRVTKEGSL